MTATCIGEMHDIFLAIPPAPSERGGEWDWYTALTPAQKRFVRRNMREKAHTPDDLGRITGLDTDAACQLWYDGLRLASVTGARQSKRYARSERPREDLFTVGDLVGPIDIAEMLEVKPATVRQWLLRGLLPTPIYVNRSGRVRLWEAAAIEQWATDTDRISTTSTAEPDF